MEILLHISLDRACVVVPGSMCSLVASASCATVYIDEQDGCSNPISHPFNNHLASQQVGEAAAAVESRFQGFPPQVKRRRRCCVSSRRVHSSLFGSIGNKLMIMKTNKHKSCPRESSATNQWKFELFRSPSGTFRNGAAA